MPDRTRDDIVEAFNRLIKQKRFSDITVIGIAREAGVGKSTFYRYFKDRYDVMNYNYKRLLDGLLNDANVTNYRDCYYHLYRSGQEVLRQVYGSFKSTGVNSFEQFIFEYSRDTVVRITKANRGGQGLNEGEKMQLDVFCYGISYMYKHWIAGNYDLTADKAADLLFDIMPASLKFYWMPPGTFTPDTGADDPARP